MNYYLYRNKLGSQIWHKKDGKYAIKYRTINSNWVKTDGGYIKLEKYIKIKEMKPISIDELNQINAEIL